MGKQIVSYIRVSTQKQGSSGLGLEAQRSAIEAFCRAEGCTILAEFQEIESGRKNDRPELKKALAFAKKHKATLLIAKLDRLARNVAFVANLMEGNVEFRAADMPQASSLILHVMSAFAQFEAEAISNRTKAALKAYTARGGKLGGSRPECRNLTNGARRKGAATVKAKAVAAYADVMPTVQRLRDDGFSLNAIVERLDRDGKTLRNGNPWNAMQVSRVLRYGS
jgi:DNA invertase Pin-like site-specific DNA recombinase